MGLEQKNVHQLRALARKRGLSGYSKLTKKELLRALERGAGPVAGNPAGTKKRATPESEAPEVERRARPRTAAQGAGAETAISGDAGQEQLVEELKFALTPPGVAAVPMRPLVDLGEDIDRLPAIEEPLLCLLPQKPGILHGYWILDPGFMQRQPGLKLRLCQLEGDNLRIVQEVPLPSERGHWYFHVGTSLADREVFLQLGYYRDREFVTAIKRGVARIPSLQASAREDREWWVSPEQFRAMYTRTGGIAEGTKLGWSESSSFSSR